MRRAVALALLAALAGCLAHPSPAAPPPAEPWPDRIELTDCTGWDGYTPPLPAALAPGAAPPGWEPSDPTASVMMGGYACQRMATGPFERGPVRLLFDAHSRASVPAACWTGQGTFTDLRVLNSLRVDDRDIAAYLATAFGMPANFSAIADDVAEAGSVRLHTWTWGGSSITVQEDGLAAAGRPNASMLFWTRGTGVGSLAISYERTGSSPTGRPAHGTLQPPMLMGALPGGQFAGTAWWYGAASAQGTVTLHGDAQCGPEG